MPHWPELHALARREVEAILDELPEPLRAKAQALPVTYARRPDAAQRRDGIEADTLGLFLGADFANAETSALPLPAQIMLFLDNLWEQVEGDKEGFCDEVRTTYLHELGHYLGLDEDDLWDRGLE